MVGAMCAMCGAVSPVGAGYCMRCGRWLATPSGAPLPPLPPPPPPGFPPVGSPAPPTWFPPLPVFTLANDGAGLERIQLASLVSFLLGLAGPILLYGVGPLLGLSPFAGFGTPAALSGSRFAFLTVAALVSCVVGLVSLWLARTGFARLRPVDTRFDSPTSLIPLAMVGLLLLVIGLPLLLLGLGPIANCVPHAANQTMPSPPICPGSSLPELAGGILLVLIGAILGLIGFIALVLGLWRLGDRYNSTLLHVGAILTIFVPFVGWLLVWLGCREQRPRVNAAAGGSAGYGAGHG